MGIYFRVRGVIEYVDVRYCGCEFCEGHGTLRELTVQVDRIVCAVSEARAVGMAENDVVDAEDWEWVVGPEVVDGPPDQVMRLIGAPALL